MTAAVRLRLFIAVMIGVEFYERYATMLHAVLWLALTSNYGVRAL